MCCNLLLSFLLLLIYRICVCISRTFLTIIYPPKLGYGLCIEYYILLTTEPATPVLYVVKLPVETTSVWDCYLAGYCTCANAPPCCQCISIFWLHESSWQHRFPEVRGPWHYWQITINAASDNQNAANAIANIFTFTQVKSGAAYVRVIIISKFLT
jgi:hypothetical protein